MNKRHYFDFVLSGICALCAIAAVGASARGGEPVMMTIVSIGLVLLVLATTATVIGWRKFTARKVLPALAVPAICLVMIISVAATAWPLRASFALARPSLENLAQRVRDGEVVSVPKQVGLLRVQRAEVYNGIVCLWINNDPGGNEGFAQCTRDGMKFNLWSSLSMSDRWQFVHED